MNASEQLRGVIFDFDLTLVDSTNAVSACIVHALDALGLAIPSTEAIHRTLGLSLEATLESLTGETDPAVQREYKRLFVEHADIVMVAQTEFLEGAISAMSDLRDRGLRLAIVSTKFRYRIEAILDRHHARGLFDVIVGGEDIEKHKPDPMGLRRALDMLGVGPRQALYVGDHVVDAEAARRAGVPFVAVLSGAMAADEFVHRPHTGILESVSRLPAFLSGGPVLSTPESGPFLT